MKKTLTTIVVIIAIAGFGLVWKLTKTGNIESQPDKTDLIRVDSPSPNQTISSPLIIKGVARGNWFFEASFPVFLTDWDGVIVAQGIAQAKNDWMTEDFVPFEATLEFKFDENSYSNKGTLILRKDNPSGLPEHDDAIEIPVLFEKAKPSDNTGILPFNSGVEGVVTLGPTCPVMKNPPDPNCADKPYQTTIQIIAIGSAKSSSFATVETNKEGYYKVMLPPGKYTLQPVGGLVMPVCKTKDIIIEPAKILKIDLSCDTGIR